MTSSSLAPASPTIEKIASLPLHQLSDEQRTSIQRLAQQIISGRVLKRLVSNDAMHSLGDMASQYVYGAFTTMKRGDQLRGCCGFLGRPTPLLDALIESAQRTAKDDPRMPAVSSIELPYLRCDVTLLSAPIGVDGPAIERAEQIELGKHGLRISTPRNSVYGEHAGLLLPVVAVEQGWDREQFLAGVCRKAGLPEDAWKDPVSRLESFEGVLIEGTMDADLLPDPLPVESAPGDLQGLFALRNAAVQNMIALSRGATPNYYVLDAMDGTVNGIVMTAINSATKLPLAHWIQTSLRPGIPLQTSLFELCRLAEQTLRRSRFEEAVDVDLALTVLNAPSQHGVIEADDWDGNTLRETLLHCDLRGINPQHRGILALCGDRASVAFDSQKSVHQLVAEAAGMVKTRRHPIAIFSMGCVSTVSSLLASNRIGVDINPAPRAPAVANAFYPADSNEMQSMLTEMESASTAISTAPAMAVMTPHAGWKYSGPVAMDAWKSVEIPPTVIMIGPKHTNLGADWAVSPATHWTLPDGSSFETDMELAKRIVASVSGMEFDNAAHYREHGIEVQLPILAHRTREGSRPKIVSIAMAPASWEEIETAANQLAEVIRGMDPQPLLVISSDMNHFASESETRRRDLMALEALESGDPKQLLEVCRKESVSMCGVVPAAWVMQTLRVLGKSPKIERLSYDTSARSSGNHERVVGYAAARWLQS